VRVRVRVVSMRVLSCVCLRSACLQSVLCKKKSACIIYMRVVCVCGLHAYYVHACIITGEFASSEDR
jgi:hypothetical protein